MAKTTVKYYLDIDESGAVRGAGRVDDALDKVGRHAEQSQSKLKKYSKYIGTAFVGALGLAFQQGFSRAIHKGEEFQSKLAELDAITGITGGRLQRLGDRSLELSQKYGTAASDIVEANKMVASQLAQKIDFNTEEGFQQLQKISEQAVVLQKAAGLSLQDAVNTTTGIINQFNLSADDADKVINNLAASSKYGAAEVPYLKQAMIQAGTAAFNAGESMGVTNAALEELAAKGQQAETAGRSMRSIFTFLQSRTQMLAKYGIKGVNIQTDGLIKTLKKLKPIMSNTTALSKVFGQENINQIQILIRNADAIQELADKTKNTSVAYDQAEKNMSTFDGATDRLWTTLDSKLIPAFTQNSGLLVQIVNGTSLMVEGIADAIQIITRLTPLIIGATSAYAAYQVVTKAATLWERRAAIARLFSTKAQKALNAAMIDNPIGLVVTALGALVGILATNGKAWEGFKTLISGVWDFLKQVFFNLPKVAFSSFKLLGEIMRTPFRTFSNFVGNIFDNLTQNFWHFLSAIRKGITGDFSGAWDELKAIGSSVGGSFVDAAAEQMHTLQDRIHDVASSADFGPAIDQISKGGAAMGSALANMFTLTADAGVQAGAGKVAAHAGQKLSNLGVDGQGNIIQHGGGGGGTSGSGLQQAMSAGMGSIATAGGASGAFGASQNVQAIQERNAALQKEMAFRKQIGALKVKSAGQEKKVTDIAVPGAKKRANALALTAVQWKDIAGKTAQAAQQSLEYGKSVKEVIKGVLKGLVNQVVAMWVRNAVQSASFSGPAALFVTPALTAVAVKAAHALMDPLISFGGGGLLSGPYHRQGGIPARVGNSAVELEGDEYVVNRESTRQALPVLDAMNADPALAARLNNSYNGRDRALTINAMPASSAVAQSSPRDIATEVSRGIREGMRGIVLDARVAVDEVDQTLDRYKKYQKRVGN